MTNYWYQIDFKKAKGCQLTEEEIKKVIKACLVELGLTDWIGEDFESRDWYHWETLSDDLCKLSKGALTNVLIGVTCESQEDIIGSYRYWKSYYLNGEEQVVPGRIVYPESTLLATKKEKYDFNQIMEKSLKKWNVLKHRRKNCSIEDYHHFVLETAKQLTNIEEYEKESVTPFSYLKDGGKSLPEEYLPFENLFYEEPDNVVEQICDQCEATIYIAKTGISYCPECGAKALPCTVCQACYELCPWEDRDHGICQFINDEGLINSCKSTTKSNAAIWVLKNVDCDAVECSYEVRLYDVDENHSSEFGEQLRNLEVSGLELCAEALIEINRIKKENPGINFILISDEVQENHTL